MKRLDPFSLTISLVSVAFCLALFLQNRALRAERDEAISAAKLEAAREYLVFSASEADEGREKLEAAVRTLEEKVAAQGESVAERRPPKDSPVKTIIPAEKPPAEGEPPRHPLQVGQEPTKERIDALGLDPLGEAALKQAIEDEEARVLDGLRKLYLEMVDPADHRVDDRSGQEMIMALADKLKPEIAEVAGWPEETKRRFGRKEISLEELLGEGNRISRVARALHAARAATYDDLARRLTPEQLAAIRTYDLPEGTFKWPNDVDIEMGAAPKDLKR